MKLFVVLALAFAVATAAPAGPDSAAETVYQENTNIGTPDGYQTGYETSNGIKSREQGAIADLGTDNEGQEVAGEYEYQGPDGNIYKVTYTAGRNGFQASGAHIPQ